MTSENIRFQSCGETLVGTIDWNIAKDLPTVLCLHGSVPGNRQRSAYLAKPLAEYGVSCLRFDYIGHGESSGDLTKATLHHLIQQAKDALTLMDPHKDLTVMGFSLGGGPALGILPELRIRKLALFAAGAWSDEALHAPYEERSQYHIHRAEQAQNASGLKNLGAFTGNFLSVIGSEDDTIAPQVTKQFIERSAQAASRDFIIIPGAPHILLDWFATHPAEQQELTSRVIRFVTGK